MRPIIISFVASAVLLFGCAVPETAPDDDDDVFEDCPPMLQQDILPQYELDISPTEWAALEDDFLNRLEHEEQGLDPNPYRVADFRYVEGSQVLEVPDVRVRLKGQSSWLQAIAFDDDPKMQFVISFNEVDKDARFMGVRKLDLDMPRTDQTFLRQRLALRYLRAAGVPAQCANSVRLVINGDYYGLYTNLERFDKEFLQRNFGDDDEGDLWESGRILKTNEDTFSWDRLDALWSLEDVATLDVLADLDAALYDWGAEVVAGDADGYANGRANFYLYDHPTRGFVWLPVDLDTAFDRDFLLPDASPLFPPDIGRWERDWHHYLVVMNDPDGLERFVAAVRAARARFDIEGLRADLDRWTAQIASSAADDPHRPFAMDAHDLATELTRDYLGTRAAFLDDWLACRQDGTNNGTDADDDGFDLCHDCNDHNREVNPGAIESCNFRDDDCNGRVDDVGDWATCD